MTPLSTQSRIRRIPLAGPRHLSGYIPDRPDHRDFMLTEPEAAPEPSLVDLRDKGPPVRDQGAEGTCTCNSSLEAVGFLYTRRGLKDPLDSRHFAYYWVRVMEGTPPTEDSGAQIRDVVKVLATRGACLESTWPYTPTTFSTEPSATAQAEAAKRKISVYYRCPSLRTIEASLAQGFPVIIGFSVPENFESEECARTGILKYPTPTEGFVGGHAVLVVGYNRAKDWLIVQNSWGTSWGDKGYFYMPFEFVTKGLATDAWTIRMEEQPEIGAAA